ncbi:MAG: metallophosphoesterase [Enterovirga sp.]|nr:metallophosphoesterase [Enterovirga sp.]
MAERGTAMFDEAAPRAPRTRPLVTRRGLVRGLGAGAFAGLSGAGYAVAVEPQRLVVTPYAVAPAAWRGGPALRAAVIADLHACEPWMGVRHIRSIVERANALRPDIVLLLGDYVAGMRVTTGVVPPVEWAGALAGLVAPLGIHAVLGNHDWWDDPRMQVPGTGKPAAGLALEAAGIRVYQNEAVRLEKDGRAFWLAGLGDQIAYAEALRQGRATRAGVDDLPATLAQIPEGAPAILMAHEPDVFARVPGRIALTLSGHTHGGQVRLFGYSPVVPSRFDNRYAYGHVREQSDLIVSGGLGCSIAPIRVGVPPEIVLVELPRS